MNSIVKNKTVSGFWLPAVTVVLSVIVAIVYGVGFAGTVYQSTLVVALPLVASALFIVLSFTPFATPYASLAAGILQFVAFLTFILVSYNYLTEAFYGGVSLGAIGAMNKAWPVTLVLLLVNVIILNIGVYKAQERRA